MNKDNGTASKLPIGPRGLPLHPGSHLYKRWKKQKNQEDFDSKMNNIQGVPEPLFLLIVIVLAFMLGQGCRITLKLNPTETPGSPAAVESEPAQSSRN